MLKDIKNVKKFVLQHCCHALLQLFFAALLIMVANDVIQG